VKLDHERNHELYFYSNKTYFTFLIFFPRHLLYAKYAPNAIMLLNINAFNIYVHIFRGTSSDKSKKIRPILGM